MENLTAYWGCMGAAMALTGILSFFLAREASELRSRALQLALLETLLGAFLGLLCAKAGYFLVRINYLLGQGFGPFWISLQPQEMLFFGGVAGVILAVFLAAKLSGVPVIEALNRFTPAGALLLALARFCEYFLGMHGVGELPEGVESLPFPLGIGIDFSGDRSYLEPYLAVFMLSGITALILAVIAFFRRNSADNLVRTLFWICLCQIFSESLRSSSIAWLFVRAEQLICFLFCEGVLLIRSIGRRPAKGWFLPALLGLLVCAALVGIEFALDKSGLSRLMLYSVMILTLGVLAFAERLSRRTA